jgi:conjugative relaxase-like TrwC/TraI family protein
MLSIKVLIPGKEHYYLTAATQGIDEYYTVRGEIPGRWVGAGAGTLGLEGRVEPEDLAAILEGRDRRTGARLASEARTVPGFDLTFSAPKSVSLLFALGEEELVVQVFAAHDAAVDAALAYLERHALYVRRGHGGARRIPAKGLIGAAFRHRTSRAGDPQLHTHALVANLALGEDDRWSTIDSRCLFRHARTAGFAYQAHLRYELSCRVGVRWGPVVHGCSEIDGIPRPVLRAFSRRRADIERVLDERGQSSAAAAEIAALSTRPAKDFDEDHEALRAEWVERAAVMGVDDIRIAGLVGLELEPILAPPDDADIATDLTADSSTFQHRDVVRAFAALAQQGVPVDSLERWTDRFLTTPYTIRVADDVYSTPEIMDLERAIVTNAMARRGARVGVVGIDVVDVVLRSQWRLSHEQIDAIRRLTVSGAGVDVVVGVAGSGKTTALGAAREAWEQTGHTVIGTALAARAAAQLEAGAGIPSRTLDRLLGDLDREPLGADAVIVVDEAAMISTRKLARLLAHATRVTPRWCSSAITVNSPRSAPVARFEVSPTV